MIDPSYCARKKLLAPCWRFGEPAKKRFPEYDTFHNHKFHSEHGCNKISILM